jgi:hypothetical protein
MTTAPASRAPASSKERRRRLRDRLTVANVLATIIGTFIAAVGGTVAIVKEFFPGGSSVVAGQVQQIAVQQDYYYGEYLAFYDTTAPPHRLPTSPATLGILVTVQASVSGAASNHHYGAYIQILSPQTMVELPLDTTVWVCNAITPSAQSYGFAIRCWIGEPQARRRTFDVRATLEAGSSFVSSDFDYAVPNPLAVLTVGGFVTPATVPEASLPPPG